MTRLGTHSGMVEGVEGGRASSLLLTGLGVGLEERLVEGGGASSCLVTGLGVGWGERWVGGRRASP